jgi:hypothetical protein
MRELVMAALGWSRPVRPLSIISATSWISGRAR